MHETVTLLKAFQSIERSALLQLLQEAQTGSAAAQVKLLLQFHPLIQKAAKHYHVKGAVDADDLKQEARLAFLNSVLEYNGDLGVAFPYFAKKRVYARLWTLVRREQTRQQRQQKESSHRESDLLSPIDALVDPFSEEGFTRALFWIDISIHLMSLSPREQMAILASLRGTPMQTLASQEQVSLETVKTWRKRALHKLRKLMEEGDVN